MIKIKKLLVTQELEQLITEIDQFKNSWQLLSYITPEQLKSLRHIATIESVGSSTRIEGAKLSDREVEKLLSGLSTHTFRSRDEEESEKLLYATLPQLSADILRLVEQKERITIAEIIDATSASRSTVKKYLGTLVDQKYLRRHGKGRMTWYTRA